MAGFRRKASKSAPAERAPRLDTRSYRRYARLHSGQRRLDRCTMPRRGWCAGAFRRRQPGARRVLRGAGGAGSVPQRPAYFSKRTAGACGSTVTVAAAALAKGTWQPPWPGAVPVSANSSIYRLALVASGRADASFALNPKWEWDIAAGALLVSEAGGTVTGKTGAPLTFNSAEAKVPGIVAAAPALHGLLIERLR